MCDVVLSSWPWKRRNHFMKEREGKDRRICLHQTGPSPRDETQVLLHWSNCWKRKPLNLVMEKKYPGSIGGVPIAGAAVSSCVIALMKDPGFHCKTWWKHLPWEQIHLGAWCCSQQSSHCTAFQHPFIGPLAILYPITYLQLQISPSEADLLGTAPPHPRSCSAQVPQSLPAHALPITKRKHGCFNKFS